MIKIITILILFQAIKSSYECLTNGNTYNNQCGLPLVNNEDKTTAQKRPYPWIVSITCNYKVSDDVYDKIGHVCGGTIISNKHIITAAHCLKIPNGYIDKKYYLNTLNPSLESVYKVAIQVRDSETEFIEYPIKKIHIHEDFNNKTLINDIGIIELENEIEFTSFIQPVCLPDQEIQGYPYIGSDSYLVAWHNREVKDKYNVKQIDMSVVNDDHCSKYGKQEFQICAKSLRTTGACRGIIIYRL
jgi:secreted trypsin-like serine protease